MILLRKTALATLLSVATITLVGCEGGKEPETTSVATQNQAQFSLNSSDTQIEMLKARLAKEPNSEQLLWAVGSSYFEAQRFREAIPYYEKAVSVNPNNPAILNDLGLAYHYVGESNKGLEILEKATLVDPNYKHAWLSQGFVLYSKGRYEEAVAPLARLKELDAGGSLSQEAERFLQQIQQITGRPGDSG